jgi:hypothetical protein
MSGALPNQRAKICHLPHPSGPAAAAAVCSFTGTDQRILRCSLGAMMSKAIKKITVEVLADGKNFVGKSILQENLNNTATLTCANSPTAGTQDPLCTKDSKANTTVRCLRMCLLCWCCCNNFH